MKNYLERIDKRYRWGFVPFYTIMWTIILGGMIYSAIRFHEDTPSRIVYISIIAGYLSLHFLGFISIMVNRHKYMSLSKLSEREAIRKLKGYIDKSNMKKRSSRRDSRTLFLEKCIVDLNPKHVLDERKYTLRVLVNEYFKVKHNLFNFIIVLCIVLVPWLIYFYLAEFSSTAIIIFLVIVSLVIALPFLIGSKKSRAAYKCLNNNDLEGLKEIMIKKKSSLGYLSYAVDSVPVEVQDINRVIDLIEKLQRKQSLELS